jgi:hypothetical protein
MAKALNPEKKKFDVKMSRISAEFVLKKQWAY